MSQVLAGVPQAFGAALVGELGLGSHHPLHDPFGVHTSASGAARIKGFIVCPMSASGALWFRHGRSIYFDDAIPNRRKRDQ